MHLGWTDSQSGFAFSLRTPPPALRDEPLMRSWSAAGCFWIPQVPDRKIPGRISFRPGVDIRVELTDELWKGAGYRHGELPCLLGTLDTGAPCSVLESRYDIELFVGTENRYRSEVRGAVGILGGHFQAADACYAKALTIRFSHLDQWLNPAYHVYPDPGSPGSAHVSLAPDRFAVPFQFDSDEINLELDCRAGIPFGHSNRPSWQAAYHLRLTAGAPTALARLLSAAVQLRRLFSFLVGRGIYTLSLEASTTTSDDQAERSLRVLVPVEVPNVAYLDAKAFTTHFQDFNRVFSPLVTAWFRERLRLETATKGYATLLSLDGAPRDLVFLRILQLMEHLHGVVIEEKGQYIPDRLFRIVKRWLGEAFPTALQDLSQADMEQLQGFRSLFLARVNALNGLSFRTRMEQLFLGYPGRVFLPILRRQRDADEYLRATLLERIEATRHFMTHSNEKYRPLLFSPDELNDVTTCCWCTLTYWLGKALGLEEPVLSDVAHSARNVSFLVDNESQL